jgi:hypothetical protein
MHVDVQSAIDTLNQSDGGAAPDQGGIGAASMTFTGALTGLGQALVGAQRALDVAAVDYSQSMRPGMPPTQFRIPKMTAGFRFAVERLDQHGLNLLIYSNSTNSREQNQQSVDVEIVAVPPDPQQQGGAGGVIPPGWLLTTETERAPWLTGELLREAQFSVFPRVHERMLLFGLATRPSNQPDTRRVIAMAIGSIIDKGTNALVPAAGAWKLTMANNVVNLEKPRSLEFQQCIEATKEAPIPSGAQMIRLLISDLCDAQARQ